MRDDLDPLYLMNPIGLMPSASICESLGHMWENITFYEHDPKFQELLNEHEHLIRECGRCSRIERNGKGGWEVATLDAGIA